MPFVLPSDPSPGNVAPASWGDAVRAALSFLANPPACRVYNSAAQNMANNAETVVAFNAERFDTDSMHSTSATTSRITINTAGVYVVTFNGLLANAADYQEAYSMLRVNGSTVIAFATGTRAAVAPMYTVTTTYKFAAGDFVEALVYQKNSAAAVRALQAFHETGQEFMATWIGLG